MPRGVSPSNTQCHLSSASSGWHSRSVAFCPADVCEDGARGAITPPRCVWCGALSSLRGLRGAPEVPPLCRETSVSRTANVDVEMFGTISSPFIVHFIISNRVLSFWYLSVQCMKQKNSLKNDVRLSKLCHNVERWNTLRRRYKIWQWRNNKERERSNHTNYNLKIILINNRKAARSIWVNIAYL